MSNEEQPRIILILCPGGLVHRGGIGRMLGYGTDVWSTDHSSPSYEIIDTQ